MAPDNRISLQKLEVFCKVAELGGVRRAAEELYISQPVVSAHLRSLQERIGARLFHPEGRGIALTEAGERALLWAAEVLRGRMELDKDLADLSDGLSGFVSIGASITVGNSILTPAVIAFKTENPSVSVRLEISAVETALEQVRLGRHDFAIVATDAVLDSRAFDSELVAQPPWAVIASTTNTKLPDTVTPAALAKLPFVCPPGGMAIRRSQDNALASIGVTDRRVEIELGSAESIKQAVAADLGVAMLWRQSVQVDIEAGSLREITVEAPPLRDKLFIVRRIGNRLTPVQRRMLDRLRAVIDERLGEKHPAIG
ncbi:LysR family transcriptional regulator [Microbacterium hydrocarbonoxydans]|uniref:DNA-binding transcriptional regulator, LysR family n=1 Tax=Microbacterium hydrocarbonoxydans TaxID=273678 RepID=A0A1H4KRB2_9MICO|nr:LysR family transcriptional regulator [Microbacterium hydrocarbonoxydans]SEB60933.1 DNA-binding transcriptional regulator, LysR family [Microbacterium hydrocarbonoxydans]